MSRLNEMVTVREIQPCMERRERELESIMLCVQMLNEKPKHDVLTMVIIRLQARHGRLEKAILGRKQGSKKYRRGKSNSVKYNIGTVEDVPIYWAEKFRRRFGIPRMLYRRLKKDLLNHRQKYWGKRMITGRRPGKPVDVKIMSFLNTLSSGNSADRNDDLGYMGDRPEILSSILQRLR